MSIAVMTSSTDFTNFSTANELSDPTNFIRFRLARLHDELSRCTYSLHGFDAVMRPVSGQVCHALIVSSYWMPGSAHSHAAVASFLHSVRASTRSIGLLSSRPRNAKSVPPSTAFMYSSETR